MSLRSNIENYPAILQLVEEKPQPTDRHFLNKILVLNEATFTRNGIFNRHKQYFWAYQNPNATRIVEVHSQHQFSINIWMGVIGDILLGPCELPAQLTVLQRQWDRKVWVMPQGLRKDGETMLQTAERVLKETCGSKLAVNFYGNAPCGVYKFRYPKKFSESVQDCSVGAKVFFFKAQYVTGHIEQDRLTPNEFRWLGREELASNVPQEYYKTIEQFLIDE
ncbi:hypothetical protein ANN_03003 [Periplaneta americana]|uniref:Nudix hydrolase domain-containing protein n=1 Tax=Periplaneta americana TaxID=6978 RepID=A0ABQ8TZ10_PERAM|nr:hypothetical protein ANN_03003 [Periplaneta americana]